MIKPIDLTRAPARRLLALMLSLACLAAASAAAAQDLPTVTVVVVDRAGFGDDELFELQYGIEQIVVDFGELELVPALDRNADLNEFEQEDLGMCGVDVDCYAELLAPLGIQTVVVLEAEPTSEEYVAYLTGLDLVSGQILSEHEGNFPDPGNSLFLLAPMFETMEPLTAVGAPARDDRDDRRDRDDRADRDDRDDRDDGERRGDDLLPPPDDESQTNVLATAMIAGGGVVTVTGIIFWMLADDTLEDIQGEPHEQPELADLQDTGESQQTIGNIAFFTGLAILATGIVFEVTGIGEPSDDDFGFDDDDWVRLDLRPGASPYVGIEVDF